MAECILVFPAGMPQSLTYLEQALGDGLSVVGSSSLRYDTARELYPHWAHLPYVGTADFDRALGKVIEAFGITGIFTPNPVVWDYLNRCLHTTFPGIRLTNGPPVDQVVAPYRRALRLGEAVSAQALDLAACRSPEPRLSPLELSSLFLHSEAIPGMCDHDKTRALIEIFRYTPSGDVVEIGSWWGKSAFILSWLGRCHSVGPLLCVDPWSGTHLTQNDEHGLLDRIAVDAEEALTIFQLNLLPYATGAINYLRLPSAEAADVYRLQRTIDTQEFGQTDYCGRIAILHIDGNHRYENACADLNAWADRVVPNGWIILDDYIWPYGDGPQRAGDEWLATHVAGITCAFVMGSALFMQVA